MMATARKKKFLLRQKLLPEVFQKKTHGGNGYLSQ
jgi:hypothetical protein